MKLRVLAEAETELLEAARYYDDRQIGLGGEFYQQVVKCMESISQDPLRLPFYEGIRRNQNFRRAIVERFPYVVIYTVLPAEALVIAVAHSSRRPGYWKGRAQ